MRSRFVRCGLLALLATLSALAVPTLAGYVTLTRSLLRRPLIERGHLASDEHRNLLARAGRPELRLRIGHGGGDGTVSAVANVWRWAFASSVHLPPDARVYLNLANPALYYYSTFFWFPRRVDVNPSPVVVSDAITLAVGSKRFEAAERPRLLEFGYTHVIDATDRGIRIFALAHGDSGS